MAGPTERALSWTKENAYEGSFTSRTFYFYCSLVALDYPFYHIHSQATAFLIYFTKSFCYLVKLSGFYAYPIVLNLYATLISVVFEEGYFYTRGNPFLLYLIELEIMLYRILRRLRLGISKKILL